MAPLAPYIMSWSITINNLKEYEGFPHDVIEQMITQHLAYGADMNLALKAAKAMSLSSCTLSGGRTPNPYGDDETVVITITGFSKAKDFVSLMRDIVVQPGDRPQG